MLLLALLCATPAWAQNTVRYAVTVTLDWDGGEAHPADKHWSRLIAFAHSSRYALFTDGDTASSGLALVATNGRVTVLEAELAEARRRDRVASQLVLPGLNSGSGRFEFEIDVSQKHRFVSFATMLAPSPDWFTGASAIELYADDAWVTRAVPLWVWDAGADGGPDFTSPNMPTQPRQSVRLLTHPAFLRPEGLRPIGTAIFRPLP
ncbi:MAG: spondin domain-containing protein [Pseudomonadota bacterium]